jgi:hypothetical protein
MPRTALLLRLPLLPHVLFVPVDGGERDLELSGGLVMAAAWGWEQMVHLGI